MASVSLVSNNGFFVTQERWNIHSKNSKPLGRYIIASCSLSCYHGAMPFPLLGFHSCCKSKKLSFCNTKIRSLVDEQRSTVTRSRSRGNNKMRRKFSLRLRPRLRLLSIRVKKSSIRSMVNEIGTFLRKNMTRVTVSASISVVLGICYLFLKVTSVPSPKVVPYPDLIMSLQNGNVKNVLFEEGSRCIYYNTDMLNDETTKLSEDHSLATKAEDKNLVDVAARNDAATRGQAASSKIFSKLTRPRVSFPKWQYSTRKIDHDEGFLLSLMREKGVEYGSAPQSVLMAFRSMLITVLSLWIPLTPLLWLLYRQFSAGNSLARRRRPNNQLVSFDDVQGIDAAKVELMEIVSCLQGAINYNKLGAKLPRGVLLVGPPGTGKTLLARAVAGEAGVPFFSVSASEFVEMFVGRGAARIRDLFSVARKSAPSIVFIDELDAVGGKRGRSFNDERDQTLNQLLTEMDGFELDNVVVIAATNRPESLDPALCRPGRFSRKVYVGEPDEDGRRRILAVHLRGVPLEEDIDLICNLVASLTQGFVGADLANIINEAALLAARRGGEVVLREDIMEAIERAKFGINEKQSGPTTISKELGKLFPWMPFLVGRNDARGDGLQGPLGYQTLS